MKCRWQEGNRITLLENGDQYYPALFAAIGRASRRVILESFIWFEDEVGRRLHAVLLEAARRGIQVEVLLDGYGSPDLSDEFVGELTAAGVIFRYYDPRPKLMGMRTNLFRRMHRKIVVIDDTTAFVGGINYSAETYERLRSGGEAGLCGAGRRAGGARHPAVRAGKPAQQRNRPPLVATSSPPAGD
ncbi:cardiolipin synthetase [Klebsiella pneumoniae subsp. ozaenae]|uniref:Cardiolipin synthetase n=1 Tax=Klebsiella pneumoniae subsp. ozaenae TaxID=574 RepID=A0A378BQG2_KLEPO|nr:cardiolipin synthetase [Klebsiella pneumoniae subsp. ozaenae]